MEVKNVGYKNLNDVSMKILDNKITGILSFSDDKSNLLKIMAGLLDFDKGEVDYGECFIYPKKIVKAGFLRKKVGFLMGDQFFLKTVKDELEFALKEYKVKDIDKRVNDSLKLVGLDDSYLNRSPLSLSSGEKKLLGLAMVLSFNPDIFILDEPVKGLDFVYREKIIKLLKMMKNRYKKTIIIGTSDSELVLKLADRVFVLYCGKVVLSGMKYKVFKNDLTQYNISLPKTIYFTNLVKDLKGIDIGYRDDISDLMKDVYRYVR